MKTSKISLSILTAGILTLLSLQTSAGAVRVITSCAIVSGVPRILYQMDLIEVSRNTTEDTSMIASIYAYTDSTQYSFGTFELASESSNHSPAALPATVSKNFSGSNDFKFQKNNDGSMEFTATGRDEKGQPSKVSLSSDKAMGSVPADFYCKPADLFPKKEKK